MASPVAARTPKRALLAGAAAIALGLTGFAAQDAEAAFTLGECQGSGSVKGQGASFQRDLHISFKTLFEGSDGCDGSPSAPGYNPNGSGNGLASAGAGGGSSTIECAQGAAIFKCALEAGKVPAGVRDLNVSFQATDEPPTPQQTAAMNEGQPGTADDALAHLIPVATGSSAFIMHAPEGCIIGTVAPASLTNGADGTVGGVDTGDRAANRTQRIRLTNEVLEAAFAGVSSADTWGEIAPGISGTPSSGQYAGLGISDCAEVPVRRIVRQDVSGTTYGWKAFLGLINPSRGWTTGGLAAPNTNWPVNGVPTAPRAIDTGTTQVCPIGNGNLCSGRSSGGGNMASAVRSVDGSIGYVDLATARANGFDISPGATQDYTFWSPLQNNPGGAATGYAEPTKDPLAHSGSVGQKGAACQSVAIQQAPTPANSPNGDPTLGDWSRAFAAGGAGYPACVLTYVVAWDDNAVVYGNSAVEEAKARTVKDYLSLIVSGVGQFSLLGADYSPLPNTQAGPMLTYAQDAVAAIDWNKRAGNVTPPPPPPPPGDRRDTPAPGGPGTPVPPIPGPPTPPSNQFSIPSRRASASQLTFTLELPAAGALSVQATSRVGRRTIRVASTSARTNGAGRVTVRLNLSAAAKRALARARGRKLKVDVAFTFTPNGGTARTVTQSVTVRAAARRAGRGRRAGRRGGKRGAKRGAAKQKSAKR